jgi:hypothetical protein
LFEFKGSRWRLAFRNGRSNSTPIISSYDRFPPIVTGSDLNVPGVCGGAEASKDIEDAEEGREDEGGVALFICPLFFTKLLKAASVPGFLIAQ